MADNQSTIRPSSDESVPSDQFLQPALTILFHPRLDRVGSIAWLEPKAQLSRNEPEFIDDHGNRSPLQDPVISRRPVQLERLDSGNYSVRCDSAGQQVRVDGQRLVDPLGLTPDDLESGVVLEIADRVVLLWHLSRPRSPLPAQPDRADPMPSDMIGRNHLMLDVHDEIRRVATLDLPVLIRGESGVGKELVARAIHGHSRRKNKPFVSINMGAVSSGTALSELFGHRRGAFTGAGGGRDGYFGQADTGTLFLDEIGEASSEVQVMLLRAIETGEIRPLGAHGVHRVDVRLITATDADLEQAVDAGAFRLPLLHRLAGFEMRVPPLRRRRDDIGRLLVHFLRQELQATGESHRLEPPERPGAAPWLPPALVARLARGQWPGNVRQLRNAARQIAIANYGLSSFRWPSAWPSTAGPDQARSSSAEPGDTPQPANRRRQNRIHGGRQGVRLDISEQALIAALRANRWRPGPTATALGIARASLYNLMNQYGSIRQARDLDRDEILACAQQCDGDLDAMVDRLEVSKRSLKLRMTELGLPYE